MGSMPALSDRFQAHVDSKFQLKDYTDFTIHCQGKEWHVHKVVLAAQSEYFANAFKPKSPFKEAQTGTIHMEDEDDDPEFIFLLLCYCYLTRENFEQRLLQFAHETFAEVSRKKRCQRLFCDVILYATADKYRFQGLVKDQKARIDVVMEDFHSAPCSAEQIRNLSAHYFSSLATEVFTRTPRREIHALILNYAAKHISYLNTSTSFKALMRDFADFHDELIDQIATNKKQLRKCEHCDGRQSVEFGDGYRRDPDTKLEWQCFKCSMINCVDRLNRPPEGGHNNSTTSVLDQVDLSSQLTQLKKRKREQ
ncbi:hypothetical protein IWZ01DRAFT_513294 [Phyllosticta capitalensis]